MTALLIHRVPGTWLGFVFSKDVQHTQLTKKYLRVALGPVNWDSIGKTKLNNSSLDVLEFGGWRCRDRFGVGNEWENDGFLLLLVSNMLIQQLVL